MVFKSFDWDGAAFEDAGRSCVFSGMEAAFLNLKDEFLSKARSMKNDLQYAMCFSVAAIDILNESLALSRNDGFDEVA